MILTKLSLLASLLVVTCAKGVKEGDVVVYLGLGEEHAKYKYLTVLQVWWIVPKGKNEKDDRYLLTDNTLRGSYPITADSFVVWQESKNVTAEHIKCIGKKYDDVKFQ